MEIIRALPAFARVGLKRSAGYKRIAKGLFPPPVKVGKRAAGFPKHEIDAIVALVVAGASDEEIKDAVSKLVALRQATARDLFGGANE